MQPVSRRAVALTALVFALFRQSGAQAQTVSDMSPSPTAEPAPRSQFSYVIFIQASPEAVWASLLEPEIQERIWLAHHIESAWKQGAPWRMLSADGKVANSGEILEFDRPSRLVLSWRNEVYPERMVEGFSRAAITLNADSGMTQVTVVHTLDRPNSALIAAASKSWPLILSNLKSLLESAGEAPKEPAVSSVTFAKHSKLTAQPAEQPAVRKFYREVLGVPQVRESQSADIFRLGPQFFLGVIYSPDAPTAEVMRDAIWLELATADPAAMKEEILAGGGKEIEYRDKDHFYFQAPGGQVFRLISDVEDMSAWER